MAAGSVLPFRRPEGRFPPSLLPRGNADLEGPVEKGGVLVFNPLSSLRFSEVALRLASSVCPCSSVTGRPSCL